jgi:hypothetical protein
MGSDTVPRELTEGEKNGMKSTRRNGEAEGILVGFVIKGLRSSVPPFRSVLSAVSVISVLAYASPASAQFDLTGKWASRSSQDAQERGPGPDAVDYLGLPLNDEGRARALSYNYSMLSLPDGQCGYLTPFYIVLGPFALHI